MTNFLLNKVVRNFFHFFQFGEKCHKILCSKSFPDFDEILIGCGQISKKKILVGTRKKFTSINFSGGRKKKLKICHFFGFHYIKNKPNFHILAVDIQNFYEFTIFNSSKLQLSCEVS